MSPASSSSRISLITSGTFVSTPGAFDGAPEGLAHALKVEMVPVTTVTRETGKKARQTFAAAPMTDRVLLDFGTVDPDAIDFDHVQRDCEILAAALREHPEVVRKAISVVCGGQTIEAEIASESAALSEVRLTEQGSREQGGGFIAVVAVVAAVLLLGGCLAECPPPQPQVPVSPGPDAGTG
jgi:hypothetical protein